MGRAEIEQRLISAAIAFHDTMGFEVRGSFGLIEVHKNRLADLQGAMRAYRGEVAPDPIDAIHTAKEEAMVLLAGAMRKFAPDLMDEFARRWGASAQEQDARLEAFLAFLRYHDGVPQAPTEAAS